MLRHAKSPSQQLLFLGGGDLAGGCGHTFVTGELMRYLKKIVFIQIELKLS